MDVPPVTERPGHDAGRGHVLSVVIPIGAAAVLTFAAAITFILAMFQDRDLTLVWVAMGMAAAGLVLLLVGTRSALVTAERDGQAATPAGAARGPRASGS